MAARDVGAPRDGGLGRDSVWSSAPRAQREIRARGRALCRFHFVWSAAGRVFTWPAHQTRRRQRDHRGHGGQSDRDAVDHAVARRAAHRLYLVCADRHVDHVRRRVRRVAAVAEGVHAMSETRDSGVTLVRGLSLTGAIAVNAGNMVGTGIFLKARVMTCNVGTPGLVMLVWVVAGLLTLAGALTYAELATMMPEAGGEYVILRR